MRRIPVDAIKPVLLGLAFVIGVVVFAAGSAVGQPPSLTAAPAPAFVIDAGAPPQTATYRVARATAPTGVVTTSQAFGY